MVQAGHHHGVIPSVTGSHSAVQVDEQEKDKTETNQLMAQDIVPDDHNQSIVLDVFSGEAHFMYIHN